MIWRDRSEVEKNDGEEEVNGGEPDVVVEETIDVVVEERTDKVRSVWMRCGEEGRWPPSEWSEGPGQWGGR